MQTYTNFMVVYCISKCLVIIHPPLRRIKDLFLIFSCNLCCPWEIQSLLTSISSSLHLLVSVAVYHALALTPVAIDCIGQFSWCSYLKTFLISWELPFPQCNKWLIHCLGFYLWYSWMLSLGPDTPCADTKIISYIGYVLYYDLLALIL